MLAKWCNKLNMKYTKKASKREKGRANTNHPNNNQTTPPLENWTVLDGKDLKTTNTNTKRNT